MGAIFTAECCVHPVAQEVEKCETELFGYAATGDNIEMSFVKVVSSLTNRASVDDELLPEKTDSTRASTTVLECW